MKEHNQTYSGISHVISKPVEGNDYYRELAETSPLLVNPVLILSDEARLRPWERVWLLDGRAALHHFASA